MNFAMKNLWIYTFLITTLFLDCMEKPHQNLPNPENPATYLALGDSYTIGEGVQESDRYPNQAVAMLAGKGIQIQNPVIIAKTGWTTDELAEGIKNAKIEGKTYDWVTLLIGVNNQYRGRPVENYRAEFKARLEEAIAFAKGNPERVVVLSIPDWGITPFAVARGTDQAKVAREIDAYNAAKAEITKQLGAHYIDITADYRVVGAKPESVVADQLHPSGLVYKSWAEKLSRVIQAEM
jgi:lysophospholipase L1-like esterase